ncbi:uncharacterized protein LOC121012036 [Herpailurus yagouaroundi]|uniref:uncharacterized protein LOC121012036 n=1 Tax=Herpailurus yagouaroundi TaxID=1608482 RepID=UPI001AD6921E|nr:uncharacterized protein LOC121012036 [Puma yagouaroundi]
MLAVIKRKAKQVSECYFPNFRLLLEVIPSPTESEFELRATRGRGRAVCARSASRKRRSRTPPALQLHFRRRGAEEELPAAVVAQPVLPSRPRRRFPSPTILRHPQLPALSAVSTAAVPRHRSRLPGPLRESVKTPVVQSGCALRALGLCWKQMESLRWTALGAVRQAAPPSLLQDPEPQRRMCPRGVRGVRPGWICMSRGSMRGVFQPGARPQMPRGQPSVRRLLK